MKRTKPTSRRNFLLAAGISGAGVAAAVVTARTGSKPGVAAPAAGKPQGYHVSEHILKYYKTTQV